MTDTTVHYARLPEGGFLAAAPHRPDVYLTWLAPGTTCSLNVSAYYAINAWVPVTIGRHLAWSAFTAQAETILGATPTHHTHAACELVFSRDLSRARCSCGHWRTVVDNHDSHTTPADLAGARRAFDAHAARELALA